LHLEQEELKVLDIIEENERANDIEEVLKDKLL
jgi:hypothetical protein